MKIVFSLISAAVLVGATSAAVFAEGETAVTPVAAPTSSSQAMAGEMKPILSMDDMQWGPAPPGLPPGSQAAVIAGDPASTGFISIRAKLPAGYAVPPHFHPTDEHVAVLSGSLIMGMGDSMEGTTTQTLKSGGYFIATANAHHFVKAETETVIQVDMIGPFDITYVNPADDPRKPNN